MDKLTKPHFYQNLVPLLIISVFTLLAHHQRVNMYFWHDDYTALASFQENVPYKFPYHFLSVFARLMYSFFDLNYQAYALISIILIILVTYLIYLLALRLFQNKNLSLLGALIFTNGYVGQEEKFELVALGLDTTLAMGMLLISLIFFFKFFKTNSAKWLFLTYLFFFLTIEIGTYRYGTAIIIFILVDWMLLLKTKKQKLSATIFRNLIFGFVFASEYVFHITRYLLRYPLSYEREGNLLYFQSFEGNQLQYLGNLIGSFWNILFPRIFQNWLYEIFLKVPSILTAQNLWISTIPILVFFILILVLIKLMRKKSISNLVFYTCVLSFCLVAFLWTLVLITTTSYIVDPVNRISILNGGLFLLFLIVLLYLKVPALTFNALFALVLFSVLAVFLYTQGLTNVFDSTKRYLYSASFGASFLPAFFITRELYKAKNLQQKYLAGLIFLLPILFLIGLPLLAGIKTLTLFKQNNSTHAIRLFSDLKKYIPEISSKKVIYLEGETKELNISVFDAVRVGEFPSETAYAVHYYTSRENIILPKKPEDIPGLLEEHKDLNLGDVFYFIYTREGLQDHSQEFRKLLREKSESVIANPRLWKVEPEEAVTQVNTKELEAQTTNFEFSGKTLGIYPVITFRSKEKINTQLPLQVRLNMKAKLANSLTFPYYHLFNRPEGAPKNLWSEILSWEIGECSKGTLKGAFECVERKNGLDSLLKDVQTGVVEVSWNYNTQGRLSVSKKNIIKVPLDNTWHDYEFTIPSSGLYLESLVINYISFPGIIHLSNMQIDRKI